MSIKRYKYSWDDKQRSETVCDLCGEHIDLSEVVDGIHRVVVTVVDDVSDDCDIWTGRQLKKTTHYCKECQYEILKGIKQVHLDRISRLEKHDGTGNHDEIMKSYKRIDGLEPKRPKGVQEKIMEKVHKSLESIKGGE